MGLMDVLSHYAGHPNRPPPEVFSDFDLVAQEADEDDLEYGIEEAFRSDETPPFEQMLGQLFEYSDDDQRAELVNQLQDSIPPAALGGLAGGPLIDLIRRSAQNRRTVGPREVRNIPPTEIETVAAEAARQNPSIIQRMSRFAARNPQLVARLGQAALTIAMSTMARRRRI